MNPKHKNILIIIFSILASFLFVVLITHSATTISANINTGGSLTVSGNSTLSGDLTVDTNTLYVDSTDNRVGIGTTTPNWNLQVAGTRPFLALSDTGAGTNSKHWFLSSQGGNFYIGTSTDALSATSTYLTITNRGFVGIGTTSPGSVLSIQDTGATSYPVQFYTSTGAPTGRIIIGSAANRQVGFDLPSTTGTTTYADNWVFFRFGGARNKIYFGDTGSVAWIQPNHTLSFIIPSVPLTNDNPSIPATTTSASFTIAASGNIGIGTSTPNWNFQIASSTKTFLTLSDMSAAQNAKHWFMSSMRGNFYVGTSTDALNATTTYFTIASGGNIGIGTTTPATLFQTSSGANATTTMSIGELGLSTSKSCVNVNTATGAPASIYIGSAGTLVVELNYCR